MLKGSAYESKANIGKKKSITDSNEPSSLNGYLSETCSYCGLNSFIKNKKYKNDVQKFHCFYCEKSFNILTNTIFENHKIFISERIKFLLHLFDYESI